MRILVTGACGLLGAHLSALLARRHAVIGVDRNPWWGDRPLDLISGELGSAEFCREAIQQATPQVVIHCAALANVDLCERNPDLAYQINAGVTQSLAQAAAAIPCLFVYVSTDGLFRGDEAILTEEEIPLPRTVYGRSKLHGEWAVQLAGPNHLIIRTNFYGWSSGRKQSAAEWLYRALERQEAITLFEDFFFTPIYVVDLAQRMARLIESPLRGIFHLGGGDRLSKGQFGRMLAEEAGFLLRNVRFGSMEAADLTAPRPKDMSLDSGRFCRLMAMEPPDFRSGLKRFIADRSRPLSRRFEPLEAVCETTRP